MNDESAFLQFIMENPLDWDARLIFADWLEERRDPRSELLRLQHILTQQIKVPGRQEKEARMCELIAQGVQPVAPSFTNSVGMEMVLIPAGRFLMGSKTREKGRVDDEKRHEVELTQPFYMAAHAVTQEQYEAVMGTNPSWFSRTAGDKDKVQGLDTRKFPVEKVSWEDAVEFCRKVSQKTGKQVQLPTEAQWEYACRAGTKTAFHFGDTLNGKEANCNGNFPYGTRTKGPYLERTCEVGSYRPNAFGLYDMHGNVWEWCQDRYEEKYYENSPWQDPQGGQNGTVRVLRGGSWGNSPQGCRSAVRVRNTPVVRSYCVGFRVSVFP
jgi:uncharacterized protein (TIGR02996 family)